MTSHTHLSFHLHEANISLAILLLLSAWHARADQYHGNGNTGFGGAIGNGTLTLSDDGTNISGTLTVGGSMNDVLVLYLQTGPSGFADTSGFNDQSAPCCQAISGVSTSGRSLLTFASGFQPNYAIALAPAAAGTGGLWQLANGGSNSLVYMGSVSLAPLDNSGPFTFNFPAALIGMIPGVRSTIQVFGTYLSTNGSRCTEAIAGDLSGTQGWNPLIQSAYANYTFAVGAVLVRLPLGVWAQRASGSSPSSRYKHTAVWTGSEVIVWGGDSGVYPYNLNDGGRFNPAANSWTPLPINGAPAARASHTAVWTGSEMVVWGGGGDTRVLNDGACYNPSANTWTALPTGGAPAARENHTAVWTGNEMLVWGGVGGRFYNDGGRYNPTARSWTVLPTVSAPQARSEHTAVWTGTEMIVWGGYSAAVDFNTYYGDGGRYNPDANTWTALPTTGAPAARAFHTAVWTGNEMIVCGGISNTTYCIDGGRYNPLGNSWMALPNTGALATRSGHTAVWTGREMIVWGGAGNTGCVTNGGRYNPTGNCWTALTGEGAPPVRTGHTAVWTGTEMILSEGWGYIGCLSDIWSYYPYAPAVRISRTGPTSADVAWPAWYPTLRLCQTTNLAAGEWNTVTNAVTQVGSENHTTLSPLSDGQFFRAEYP
ncbi:MAG TPA: hypothetical protein VMU04_02015 [Candidatus Acidoferrum sp.]|nr:hypothetical protein [Candidatus Acidoferrum sp.]